MFELSPSGGGWSYTSSYFDESNGAWPESSVAVDASGNLYGAAMLGGEVSCGCGTVWEITP